MAPQVPRYSATAKRTETPSSKLGRRKACTKQRNRYQSSLCQSRRRTWNAYTSRAYAIGKNLSVAHEAMASRCFHFVSFERVIDL
jgi:hypothetical protein